MGDSNSKSSHSDCLKQAKALVFWHLGLGSPQKQSLRCRPVIWEIISENKSEARRWRGGKSVQGYSVGTGGSVYSSRISWEKNSCLPELFPWRVVDGVLVSWFTLLITRRFISLHFLTMLEGRETGPALSLSPEKVLEHKDQQSQLLSGWCDLNSWQLQLRPKSKVEWKKMTWDSRDTSYKWLLKAVLETAILETAGHREGNYYYAC